MNFDPKTEAEVAAAGLFVKGTYDFEVTEAKEKTSKNGNDMVELLVRIYDAEGKSRKIFDYLVATDGGAYKIRHFAEAAGMLADYEKGTLQALDMVGKTGRCEVGIQKDKTGAYPDKNVISDYVTGGTAAPAKTQAELDDEIPF